MGLNALLNETLNLLEFAVDSFYRLEDELAFVANVLQQDAKHSVTGLFTTPTFNSEVHGLAVDLSLTELLQLEGAFVTQDRALPCAAHLAEEQRKLLVAVDAFSAIPQLEELSPVWRNTLSARSSA